MRSPVACNPALSNNIKEVHFFCTGSESFSFPLTPPSCLPLPRSAGHLRDHPQEGEGQAVHGGDERAVVEPAAGRAPAERLAQRAAGDAGGALAAQPHRNAAGLRGRDAHLLRRRPDPAARLPLCLHPAAVPRLLDRRGGQHHPLLHVSTRGQRWWTVEGTDWQSPSETFKICKSLFFFYLNSSCFVKSCDCAGLQPPEPLKLCTLLTLWLHDTTSSFNFISSV